MSHSFFFEVLWALVAAGAIEASRRLGHIGAAWRWLHRKLEPEGHFKQPPPPYVAALRAKVAPPVISSPPGGKEHGRSGQRPQAELATSASRPLSASYGISGMLGPNLYPGLGAAAAAFGRQAELRAKQRHLDEVNAAIAQAERLTATEALRAQSDAYRQLDQQINSDFAKLSAELAANMDRAIRYGGTLGSGPRSVRTERIDPPNGDRGSKG